MLLDDGSDYFIVNLLRRSLLVLEPIAIRVSTFKVLDNIHFLDLVQKKPIPTNAEIVISPAISF